MVVKIEEEWMKMNIQLSLLYFKSLKNKGLIYSCLHLIFFNFHIFLSTTTSPFFLVTNSYEFVA